MEVKCYITRLWSLMYVFADLLSVHEELRQKNTR